MTAASFTLTLPATTANLGPGFDTLGLAMALFNEFEVTVLPEGAQHTVSVEGFGQDALRDPKRNLFFTAYETTCQRHAWPIKPLSVRAVCRIPLESGIGSSATAVVAGVAAAHKLYAPRISRDMILADSLVLEGHPDNVSACVFGGLTVSILTDHGPLVSKTPLDTGFCCWVIHPARTVNTEESRTLLPRDVRIEDAIFSLSRAALLTAALIKGEMHLLRESMKDRIHEPSRMDPFMEYPRLKEKLMQDAAFYGWAISGSGPSVVVLCAERTEFMKNALHEHFTTRDVAYTERVLSVDNDGLRLAEG